MALITSSAGSKHMWIFASTRQWFTCACGPGVVNPTKFCGGITLPSFGYPTLTYCTTTHSHKHNTHSTQTQDELLPPYPQRLWSCYPWQHLPWTRIAAPRLPMSLLESLGGRVHARCSWFPWLGCLNGPHQKNERWAEHRPWVAATWWGNTITNRRLAAAVGGALKRRRGQGGTCGEDVYLLFGVANGANKK
jgi:hypothetical protein